MPMPTRPESGAKIERVVATFAGRLRVTTLAFALEDSQKGMGSAAKLAPALCDGRARRTLCKPRRERRTASYRLGLIRRRPSPAPRLSPPPLQPPPAPVPAAI